MLEGDRYHHWFHRSRIPRPTLLFLYFLLSLALRFAVGAFPQRVGEREENKIKRALGKESGRNIICLAKEALGGIERKK